MDKNLINDRSTSAVFFLSSVFGITPLVIVNGKLKFRYFLLCHCTVTIIANILLGYATQIEAVHSWKNNTAETFLLLIVTSNCFIHIYNVYFNSFNTERFNDALKKMCAVDFILSQQSVTHCYARSRLDSWLEINLAIFYWILVGFQIGSRSISGIFFSINSTYFALISAEFLTFGKYLVSQFETIVSNVSLLQTFEKKKKELNAVSFFNRLCDVHKHFNAIYSHRFTLLSFKLLYYTVSRLHITYHKNDLGTIDFFCRLYGILFHWIIFLRIVACSAAISQKSKQFNDVLYQLMIEDKTKRLLNNQKLRLHISMKREVVFSAGGFFNMDYTLVHSVIAAATTYVAILVQFQKTPQEALASTVVTNITNSTVSST